MATNNNGLHSYFLAAARISLGLIFLWAFFDKLFGLKYATEPGKAWLDGVSPTMGFLKFGAKGPFTDMYHSFAGNPLVDWLFMLGLLGIGLALTFGFALRFAGYAGALLMLLMWTVAIPPKQNPVFDDHIVYLFVLLALAHSDNGEVWGIGKWWSKSAIAKSLPFLK